MNGRLRRTFALFTTVAMAGFTLVGIAAIAPPAAAAPICGSVCSFRIGNPPSEATGTRELGLQFHSDIGGWLAGVCFWVAPNETGNHTVSVWDSSGTLLGSAISALPAPAGQETCVDLNPLVPVSPNATYTVSYTSNTAFEVQPGQFHPAPLEVPPLFAPVQAGVSGSPGSFPTTATALGDGYGVDVAFIDTMASVFNDCVAPMTAPTNPSSAPGNASATVSWAPATSDPDGCIAGYVVTPFLNGVRQGSTLIPGPGTTTVIKGLTNGQTYTFTIAAESGRTIGPESVPTGPVTIGTPAAATALKVSRVGKGTVKVAFKAARNHGARITKYTATCRSSAGAAKSKAGKSSPIVVNGLNKGKAYRCTVKATNRRGTGPQSKQSAKVKA